MSLYILIIVVIVDLQNFRIISIKYNLNEMLVKSLTMFIAFYIIILLARKKWIIVLIRFMIIY